MSVPATNVETCLLCGHRDPSHALVTLDGEECGYEKRWRVCASHSVYDLIMWPGKSGWRIDVRLSLYEDVAHVAERKQRAR